MPSSGSFEGRKKMRILIVTPEDASFSGGGIGTYIRHAMAAHKRAGHEVFVASFTQSDSIEQPICVHQTDTECRISFNPKLVEERTPKNPLQLSLSHLATPYLIEYINSVKPTLIESTDYLAPLYDFLLRRRTGGLGEAARIPVAIYNHGMQREVCRANAYFPGVRWDYAAERLVLKWCDLILSPSRAARASMIRQIGEVEHVAHLPEPFEFSKDQACDASRQRFVHVGRLSFSKGIDREIRFINAISTNTSISEIVLIGRDEWLPFRLNSAKALFNTRITPNLVSKLNFVGQLPYDQVSARAAGGGFSMNFSLQETYNYAFLEMLDVGLIPVVLQDTPMTEFLPASRQALMMPYDFNGQDAVKAFEYARGLCSTEEIVEHCKAQVSYDIFSARYAAIADRLMSNPAPRSRIGKKKSPLRPEDVSILIATYNDHETLLETIASVKAQTVTPSEIVIWNDGASHPAAKELLRTLTEEEPLVRVFNSKVNEGLGATRNKLLDTCKTPLFIFLDADDKLSPSYIERTLLAYNEGHDEPDAVMTYRKNFVLNEHPYIFFNYDDYTFYLQNSLYITALMRTNVAKDIGFREHARNGEADDWAFWLQFKNAGYKIICVPEFLFEYRFRHGSMSWPFSHGQGALTVELVANAISQIPNHVRLPDFFYQDLIGHLLHGGSENIVTAARGSRLERRVRYIESLQARRPKAAKALVTVVNLAGGIAKRL
jgi:glycosyltransferase involved in cell wall biosynthesis